MVANATAEAYRKSTFGTSGSSDAIARPTHGPVNQRGMSIDDPDRVGELGLGVVPTGLGGPAWAGGKVLEESPRLAVRLIVGFGGGGEWISTGTCNASRTKVQPTCRRIDQNPSNARKPNAYTVWLVDRLRRGGSLNEFDEWDWFFFDHWRSGLDLRLAETTHDHRIVLTAETEGVGEAGVDAAGGVEVSRGVGDVIEIAVGVGVVEVHGGGNPPGLDRFDAGDELDGAGGLD